MGPKEEKLRNAISINKKQNSATDETIFDLSLTICHRNTANSKDLEDPIQQHEIEKYFVERFIGDARYLIDGALAEKYDKKLKDAIRRSQNEEVMGSNEIKRIFAENVIADALREMRVY